ncbi:hypothetical protein JTB14_028625 [Gonioctena quinquepunctata]|nr:hypothetical protein JTB14_028625 [Gonioctena quinquepunctata]
MSFNKRIQTISSERGRRLVREEVEATRKQLNEELYSPGPILTQPPIRRRACRRDNRLTAELQKERPCVKISNRYSESLFIPKEIDNLVKFGITMNGNQESTVISHSPTQGGAPASALELPTLASRGDLESNEIVPSPESLHDQGFVQNLGDAPFRSANQSVSVSENKTPTENISSSD